MLIYRISMNDRHDAAGVAFDQKVRRVLGMDDKQYEPTWPLPNLKEIAEKDFWHYAMSYLFEGEVYRQSLQIDGEWWNVRIFIVDSGRLAKGGYVVLYKYRYQEEKVRYFTFAQCDHAFEPRTVGNCLTRYTCQKCGSSHEIDSSG